MLDAKEAGTKADGKGFDAHAAEFGYGKVAKLVNNHHEANEHDESDGDKTS